MPPPAHAVASFEFIATPLSGVAVIQRKRLEDYRGFVSRFYCVEEFRRADVLKPISQINHTLTRRKGTVRGLHFQRPPHAETKVVSCLKGEIFDVAVDLRANSPTFLQWHAEVLTAGAYRAVIIPEGFAHGFQALSDDCETLYLVTAAYCPEAEDGLLPTDARLNIAWPLPITDMSDRDRRRAPLTDRFAGIELAR